jgi:hypothetical protein
VIIVRSRPPGKRPRGAGSARCRSSAAGIATGRDPVARRLGKAAAEFTALAGALPAEGSEDAVDRFRARPRRSSRCCP